MTWPTVTVDEKATYGDTWADIISLSGGSASLDGKYAGGMDESVFVTEIRKLEDR